MRDRISAEPANVLSEASGPTTDGQLAELVDTYNDLMEQNRFAEAESIVEQIDRLAPDNPVDHTLFHNSRTRKRVTESETDEGPSSELAAADSERERAAKAMAGPPRETVPEFASGPRRTTKSNEYAESLILNDFESAVDPTADVTPSRSPTASEFDVAGGMEMEEMMEMEFDMADLAETQPTRQPRRSRRGPSDVSIARNTDAEITDMDMMMDILDRNADGLELGSASGDRFAPIEDNPFVRVDRSPLSTFSIDVDTASYAKVRSLLTQSILPRPEAVRIEELLNYFDYDYPAPNDDHPFAASMEIAACPWNANHRLARVGIKGREIEVDRPSSNLVFLLDVSGSMDEPNKLPLVIEGMKMMTDQLTENDKVSIVVYAGAAGLVLDATRGDKKRRIGLALDRLKAGGSTNGGQGIMLAYELARDNFIVGGTNRVILCSDGDFNVGVTGTDQLVKIAAENAKSNIFLSVLGFGTGNHNDAMMEQISNRGNGNYAFIDSKAEAKKVLVEELGGTLVTIAKDVKIQIEFNPKHVASYRLIGYENRVLSARDFNNDKKDAGEIGAGHTVTALYEIVPADEDGKGSPSDGLRYQEGQRLSQQAESGELLVLKLRYKQPDGDTSTLIEVPAVDSGKRFSQTDRDFKFAAAVAAFGMLLRESPHCGDANLAKVARIAREGAKGDDFGYRTEFVSLVEKAEQLRGF